MGKTRVIFFLNRVGPDSICKFMFNLLVGATVLVSSQRVFAETHEIGIAIGTPSQLTYQLHSSKGSVFNFGLAFDLNPFMYFSGDSHLNLASLNIPAFHLPTGLSPYVGLGAFIAVHTQRYGNTTQTYWGAKNPESVIGIRIPVGLEYRPAQVPVTLFAELAPSLAVIPATTGQFQMFLGVRYRF